MVSAHWEDAPTTLGSTTGAPLVYDFWGFPQKYYEVTYDAPAAPDLADDVTRLLTAPGQTSLDPVHRDESRGLDHGPTSPSRRCSPRRTSRSCRCRCRRSTPAEIGRPAPLRDQGAHRGLRLHDAQPALVQPTRRRRRRAADGERRVRPLGAGGDEGAGRRQHPRLPRQGSGGSRGAPATEHFGAALRDTGRRLRVRWPDNQSVIEGFWFGLSKRSWQFN